MLCIYFVIWDQLDPQYLDIRTSHRRGRPSWPWCWPPACSPACCSGTAPPPAHTAQEARPFDNNDKLDSQSIGTNLWVGTSFLGRGWLSWTTHNHLESFKVCLIMFCLDIVDMVGWLAHKILETAQVETLNCWEFKFGLRHSKNFRKDIIFLLLDL